MKQDPGKHLPGWKEGTTDGKEEGELGCGTMKATELSRADPKPSLESVTLTAEVKELWIKVKKTLLTFPKLGLSTCDGFCSGKVKDQIIAKASKIFLGSPKDEGG